MEDNIMANENRTKVITGKNTRLFLLPRLELSASMAVLKNIRNCADSEGRYRNHQRYNAAVDAAIEEGIAKFGGKKPNKAAIKLPLRDGDVKLDDDAYKGHYFVKRQQHHCTSDCGQGCEAYP
jgi:hypothetical protein